MALRYEINLQTGVTFSLALRTAQPESVSGTITLVWSNLGDV